MKIVLRHRPVLLLLISALLSTDVMPHETRPNFIRIREKDTGVFIVNWKTPASIPEFSLPVLVMPDNCLTREAATRMRTPDSYISQQEFTCTQGLTGRPLRLEYPIVNPSLTSLFLVEFLGGVTYNHILQPGVTEWMLPETESRLRVAREYLSLGIQHIFAGVDHLLFIACLVIIARTPRRVLLTITGFTIAHSITLALSTLRLVELPVPPVEASIALSIIFLAHEIAVKRQDSWTWRYPITVSSCFGLLHGFGFAAVLRAIGLPQIEFPAALLFFNIGVEIGQVLFVAVLALVIPLWNRLSRPGLPPFYNRLSARLAAYLIGSVASFWFVQRVLAFWQ
jgi:hydrogenase/urease accessory protein HupE